MTIVLYIAFSPPDLPSKNTFHHHDEKSTSAIARLKQKLQFLHTSTLSAFFKVGLCTKTACLLSSPAPQRPPPLLWLLFLLIPLVSNFFSLLSRCFWAGHVFNISYFIEPKAKLCLMDTNFDQNISSFSYELHAFDR